MSDKMKRQSNRVRRMEPDSPSALHSLATSDTSSHEIRNLSQTGGHGGRIRPEADPSLLWNFEYCRPCSPAPPEIPETPAPVIHHLPAPPDDLSTPDQSSTTESIPTSTEATTQSGKKKRPKTPCVFLLKPHEKLKGNRILDIAQIQNIVQEHMVCKKCAEKKETKLLEHRENSLTSYLKYCEAYSTRVGYSTVA